VVTALDNGSHFTQLENCQRWQGVTIAAQMRAAANLHLLDCAMLCMKFLVAFAEAECTSSADAFPDRVKGIARTEKSEQFAYLSCHIL
jgi:hypothetical protein